jgi:hypothetical protein
MLSSSRSKIHNPRVTRVSPRPTDRLQHQKTAKHEGSVGSPHRSRFGLVGARAAPHADPMLTSHRSNQSSNEPEAREA